MSYTLENKDPIMSYTIAKNRTIILRTINHQNIDNTRLKFQAGVFGNMKFTAITHSRIILKDDRALVWTTKPNDDYPSLEDFRMTIFKFTINENKEARQLKLFMAKNTKLGLNMDLPETRGEDQYVIIHRNRRTGNIDGQLDLRFNRDEGALIETVGTDKNTGGTGIALIRTAEQIAQFLGYQILVIGVALDNAKSFYTKLGYKFIESRFYPNYRSFDSSMYIPLTDIDVIDVASNTSIRKIPLDEWLQRPDIELWSNPDKKRTLEGNRDDSLNQIQPTVISLVGNMFKGLFQKTEKQNAFTYFK